MAQSLFASALCLACVHGIVRLPTGQHCVFHFSSNCRQLPISPAPAANLHAVHAVPLVAAAALRFPSLIIANCRVQLAAVVALNAMRFRFVEVFRFRVRCLTIRADWCRCVFCHVSKHHAPPRTPATHAATSARNAARLPQPRTTTGNAARSAALISVVRAMPTVSASAVPIVHRSPGSCLVCAICSHPSHCVDNSSQSSSGLPQALQLSILVPFVAQENAPHWRGLCDAFAFAHHLLSLSSACPIAISNSAFSIPIFTHRLAPQFQTCAILLPFLSCLNRISLIAVLIIVLPFVAQCLLSRRRCDSRACIVSTF